MHVFDGRMGQSVMVPAPLLTELFRESPVPEWTIAEGVDSLEIVEGRRARSASSATAAVYLKARVAKNA
jgi:hypothetical protein